MIDLGLQKRKTSDIHVRGSRIDADKKNEVFSIHFFLVVSSEFEIFNIFERNHHWQKQLGLNLYTRLCRIFVLKRIMVGGKVIIIMIVRDFVHIFQIPPVFCSRH